MSHRNCPQIEDVPSFTDPRLLWTPPLHWTQAPQQESPGDGRVRESEEGAAVTATATAAVSESLCPTPPLLLCTVVQTILSGSAPGPQPSHPLQGSVGWSHLTSGQGCLSTHFQNSRLPGAPGPTQSHTPPPHHALFKAGQWPWQPGGRAGRRSLPVFQGELGQLPVVVEPLELQRPAALGHACKHQAVSFQVHLCPYRLCLEIRGHVICRNRETKSSVVTCSPM